MQLHTRTPAKNLLDKGLESQHADMFRHLQTRNGIVPLLISRDIPIVLAQDLHTVLHTSILGACMRES